jgi:hypothetical protein
MARKSPLHIELTTAERSELKRRARAWTASYGSVIRAKAILSIADGQRVADTADKLGLERLTVRKWAQRFVRKRLSGLEDEPRSGGSPLFSPGSRDSSGQTGM